MCGRRAGHVHARRARLSPLTGPVILRWERAAPVGFILLWSTGYIGAKYGLPYAGPFTFLAIRLAVATVVMATLALVLRAEFLVGMLGLRAAVGGLLLHGGLLGGTFYALANGVSAGVAAVVIGLQPLLVAVLASRLLAENLTSRQWAGLILGLAGVVLVLTPGLQGSDAPFSVSPRGIGACVVAMTAGALGTLWQKRHGGAMPLLWGTTVQYAAATVAVGAAAVATEPLTVRWTPQFLGAIAWLVVMLSIGAILLLFLLLRRRAASSVSSLFYLVPPATALQGHLLFGERLAPVAVLGMAVVAVGVALVVRRPL